ncbi:MAG: membrane protein insertion efficiency factor YidD [Desulfobacterales bacterium]|nr:membrane protein insertion efficiency factor YidD [Desulfobacterales bacterium]
MIAFLGKIYYRVKKYGRRSSGRHQAAALLAAVVFLAGGCGHNRTVHNPAEAHNFGPVQWAIDFYQGPLDHFNAVRTGQCPMYPSCSQYASQAVAKHGPAVGAMLACDRLIRCGRSELDYAPKIPVNGKWRYYDPVSANDFWFSDTP